MTDIVERLRRYHKDDEPPSLYDEAADEIEQLQAELARIRGLPRLAALDAEIERLTAWLQEIAREQDATDADYFQALARAALAGQPIVRP